MSEEFATVAPRREEVPRDRWGRPLIFPPGKRVELVPYTRASSVGKTIDNTAALESWKVRKALVGVALRKDLAAIVASHAGTSDEPESKKAINKAAAEAQEAAGSSARANLGTALHSFTEAIDLGADPLVPDEYRADIDAYRLATAGLAVEAVEEFVVHDELKIAGTFDRIVTLTEPARSQYVGELPAGTRLISDLKAGSDVYNYAQGAIAIQLAIYANSKRYTLAKDAEGITPRRSKLNVNTDIALCVHLPVGEGRASVYEVDIRAGIESARLAMQVKAWQDRIRKRKDLFTPFAGLVDVTSTGPADEWIERAARCRTAEQVRQVWRNAKTAGLGGADLALLEERCRVYVQAASMGALAVGDR